MPATALPRMNMEEFAAAADSIEPTNKKQCLEVDRPWIKNGTHLQTQRCIFGMYLQR